MVMAILVNTSGMTVYNHFCLEEGESSLSLSRLENCCGDKKEIVNEKHSCCKKKKSIPAKNKMQKPGCCSQDEFSAQWKMTDFSIQKTILISTPVNSAIYIIPQFKLNFTEKITETHHFSPPILFSHLEILHLHSVLII